MKHRDVLERSFELQPNKGWIALRPTDPDLLRGFRTGRIAKVRGERLYFTIGETSLGKSTGLSERIRRAISDEGLEPIAEPTTSGQLRGEKEYVGFDLSAGTREAVERLLSRILDEITGGSQLSRASHTGGRDGGPAPRSVHEFSTELGALERFERRLRAVMERRDDLRPFVCSGSPLECEIFIVGYNPATEMSRSFWSFWDPATGFDKDAWFQAYREERAARPLREGKTRRNAVSNTRHRIDWIVEGASPISCLETNLYGAATEQARDLSAARQDTTVFDFLVQEIRPKVILLHGADAHRYMAQRLGQALEPGQFTTAQVESVVARLLPVSHLSRGWSEKAARQLGQRLRDAVEQA